MSRRVAMLVTLPAVAAVAAVAVALAGCAGDLPANYRRPIPQLPLDQTVLRGVMRSYGQPKQRTATTLWYVGPAKGALLHGAGGWMTLLSFDDEGHLRRQEFLSRRDENGYVRADYWIRGRLAIEKRDLDLDGRLLPLCRELAKENADYAVTADTDRLFVLARRLPSENEPVVQCQVQPDGDRGELTLLVRAMPGRDEPLLEKLDLAIGLRMLLIEIPADSEAHSPTEGQSPLSAP